MIPFTKITATSVGTVEVHYQNFTINLQLEADEWVSLNNHKDKNPV
ncbi:hypothetical protein [Gelidibacter mesophilus]|nr:hypothetical protein [Gelidibacter mesophilus]